MELTSHVKCTEEERLVAGINERLIRYSAGIEDLIADTSQAFSENVYEQLLIELRKDIPLSADGRKHVLDKAHIELAMGILESMWCGWSSNAKAKRGVYPSNYPTIFKEAIIDAFEIGESYANEKP